MNALTGFAKLTNQVNTKFDEKSLRSSRTRLNKALNRYCTSTVPKHLTSSSSKFLSQSGKNILDKLKTSRQSVMPSSTPFRLPRHQPFVVPHVGSRCFEAAPSLSLKNSIPLTVCAFSLTIPSPTKTSRQSTHLNSASLLWVGTKAKKIE